MAHPAIIGVVTGRKQDYEFLTRITAEKEEQLFQLHACFFRNLDRGLFHGDLRGKDWVITVSDGPEFLAFSTIRLYLETVDDRSLRILFSGDTVVHPEYWSRSRRVLFWAHEGQRR